MELDELMRGLAAKHGIPGVKPLQDGSYGLLFDDLAVAFVARETELLMSARLAEKPAEGVEGLSEILLAANRQFAATDGNALAFDADAGVYTLERREPLAALDVETFSSLAQAFVNKADDFQRLIEEFVPAIRAADGGRSAGQPEGAAFGMNGFMQV